MSMLEIIELVAETAKHQMYYTVELLEEPKVQVFVEDDGRYGVNYFTHEVQHFFSADDTIQFLSDKELFGFEVKSYDFSSNWNQHEELRIVLYRLGGN